MPISYNKCWKCPPLRSSQRCTRRIMLANTFCNVQIDILSTMRWMLASTLAVCVDDLNTQYPWDAPIKISLGIVEATVSLKCDVQETQIPSNPWVAWLFEHPVHLVQYTLRLVRFLCYRVQVTKKAKQSRYTQWRRLWGEKICPTHSRSRH
jgi:hypothetical protein